MPELDFSEYHPLDHPIGSWDCWHWFGGPVRHLQLWWDYQRPRPIQAVKCRLGYHNWTDYWVGRRFGDDTPPAGQMCHRCLTKR